MNQELLDAIEDRDLPRVEEALQNGADVNSGPLELYGWRPLHLACYSGHLAIAQFLLNHGANLEATEDDEGMTPLHLACEWGHPDLVRYLLTRGANLEATDIYGMTPLSVVCFEGQRIEVVEYLSTHGANLEAADHKGKTPLHHACQKNYYDAVEYLLAHGANVEAVDNAGRTPLHYVCERQVGLGVARSRLATARLLVEAGADLNARDNDGYTCLHRACFYGALEIARFLLEQGAELFSVSNNGETSFDLAVEEGNGDVVEYLLQAYAGTVTQREGRQAIHAILQLATYSHPNFHPPLALSFSLRVQLPLGKLSVGHFRTLLQLFPTDSIFSRNHNGACPIHVACGTEATFEIRRLLVEQDTTASTLWLSDNNGALPLHVACRSNASIDDIRFLVQAGGARTLRAKDHTGALPLHALSEAADPSVEAVQYLLELHRDALTTTTDDGDLPFMVAVKASASESVLQVLLTRRPQALEYMQQFYGY